MTNKQKRKQSTSSVRKLSAIRFADIIDYIALMQSDETTACRNLEKLHNTLNTKVNHHKGQVNNNYGDGCFYNFKYYQQSEIFSYPSP